MRKLKRTSLSAFDRERLRRSLLLRHRGNKAVLPLFRLQSTMKSVLVLLVLLVSFAVEKARAAAATVCPKKGSVAEGVKYHDNRVCNRDAYNVYKANVGRYDRLQSYKKVGGVSTVPNQKTITCPVNGGRVSMKDAHTPNVGLDTVWVVENHASTPVVVSYVNAQGVEVSARNPKISPATADPTAILKPNAWMAVYAFEGHEFVVREVLKSGIAGNVLLQHRAGLLPIGANFAMAGISCDPSQDIEPMVDETTTAPVFQRTPTQIDRPCNTMDIGFRNVASCPLHGYYVRGEGDQCTEKFKLHLGVESMTTNFIKDWTSATKYEGSFIGHTFHFRLASNPTILVDTVTLQPIYVTDCPVSSAAAVVSETNGVNMMTQIGNVELTNTTNTVSNEMYEMLYQPTNATATIGSVPQQIDKPRLTKII